MITATAIRPIRDEASYEAAAAEVRSLWGAAPGTEEGDRLDVLLTLVDAYEAANHAVAPPHPIEAVKARMEDKGLTRDDLGALLGIASGRVSELLNCRRRLTLDMIRALAKELGLTEACLVQPYELAKPGAVSRRPPSHLRDAPPRDR